MNKEMMKARIMEALNLLFLDTKEKKMTCFECNFGSPERHARSNEDTDLRRQRAMAAILITLGVPRGTHTTFVFTEEGWVYSNVGGCNWLPKQNPIDPDWEKFVDEIVSLSTT